MVKKLILSGLVGLLTPATSAPIEADALLGQSSDPSDYRDRCPTFRCNDLEAESRSESRYLSQQVYCFKSDFAEPLAVLLKDCQGEGGMYCSGSLNRCMADPYQKLARRLPGSRCEFPSECLSRFCQDHVCMVVPDEEGE